MSQKFILKVSRLAQLTFVFVLLGTLIGTPPVRAWADTPPWMNTSLPAEERAKLLLAEMTLAEKVNLVTGDKAGAERGYVGHISAIPRLGIPELNMKDGPAGVGNGALNVTAFPAPITVAASWDTALMEQYGTALAEEQRGKGVNVHLAPMMNIDRVPQAGRNFEGYGEDPYLSAQMAAVEVRGIQSTGLIAVAKHYIANEQEFQRTEGSSEIDIRTQHEIYLPPFKASVEAGVGSIMCSYNKINGVYGCENSQTQNELLKGELGFNGWIMSDWSATHSTIDSAVNGLDMEMPGGSYFGRTLQGTVDAQQVPVSRLDDMVLRILTVMFRAGLFDREPAGSPDAMVQSDAHTALARNAAAQGMVLLKNERSILPLDPAKLKSIVVFGSVADVDPIIVGGGSGYVNAPYIISPLQGIKNRAGNGVAVRYFDYATAAGQPIPAEVFQTPDGAPGLKAEYFNTPDLSGEPVQVTTTPNLDFAAGIVSAAGERDLSARWTGVLTPKVSGIYNLALTGKNSRLYLNDELVLESTDNNQPQIMHKRLIANRAYNVRVEYTGAGEGGGVQFTWYTPEQDFKQDAAAIAVGADIAIVVTGINSNEGSDRQSLDLSDQGLITAVAAANPNTLVVAYSPAQVLMPWADQVSAILLGWIPGQEAGNALADVLFGDVNPAGRLPMTFAKDKADFPANTPETYPGRDARVLYAEGLRVGYRHFDSQNIEPLYPFGHGLSYTTFEYNNLQVTPNQTNADGNITVTVDVKNTGQRVGAEVTQLYLDMPAETSEPPKQLKGFAKLTLQPGETQAITFTLTPAEYSFWSAGLNAWVAYPGVYQVLVGASSRDIRQTGTFTVGNEMFNGEIIQAESAVLTSGASLAKDQINFTGAGFVNGFTANGSAAQFKVNVAEAGNYNVIARYASTLRPGEQNTPRTLSLYVNGAQKVQIQFPNLANWEIWDFKSATVALNAGENAITYQFDSEDNGDVHLDAIVIVKVVEPTPVPAFTATTSNTAQPSTKTWLPLTLSVLAILALALVIIRFIKRKKIRS